MFAKNLNFCQKSKFWPNIAFQNPLKIGILIKNKIPVKNLTSGPLVAVTPRSDRNRGSTPRFDHLVAGQNWLFQICSILYFPPKDKNQVYYVCICFDLCQNSHHSIVKNIDAVFSEGQFSV